MVAQATQREVSDLVVDQACPEAEVAPRPRWPGDDPHDDLRSWQRAGRAWHHAWPVLVATVAGFVIWIGTGIHQWAGHRTLFWLDVGAGLCCLVMMPWRHRFPLGFAIAMIPAAAISASATGAGAAQIVALSRRRRLREIIPVAAVSIVVSLIYPIIEPQQNSWWIQLVLGVVFVAAYCAFGMYLGARTQLLETLRDRAESAEREQALHVARARRQERDRIAREMHDVLAHRISLVCMHASALSFRPDASREEVRRSVDIIERNAHQALADLREVIGVLRDRAEETGQPAPPQPSISDIPALVDEVRAAGMHVDLLSLGPADAEPPQTIGRSGYRIVQEGLTNARKHAPGTRVQVTVTRSPGEQLLVRISNPLPIRPHRQIPGSGTGLQGLEERAAISGGDLEHGRHDGQFVLSARLPWPA